MAYCLLVGGIGRNLKPSGILCNVRHSTKSPGIGLPLFNARIMKKYAFETNSVRHPLREVAMMAIMSRLTGKPDWHRKVFDEIVARGKTEALAIPDDVWVQAAAASNSRWEAGSKFEQHQRGRRE